MGNKLKQLFCNHDSRAWRCEVLDKDSKPIGKFDLIICGKCNKYELMNLEFSRMDDAIDNKTETEGEK